MATNEGVQAASTLFSERAPWVKRDTPLLSCSHLTELLRAAHNRPSLKLYLKAEHLQLTGSFKIRGASNVALQCEPGTVLLAHSSGNHGQGVACAAQQCGLESVVVVPSNAPEVKKAAMRGYGARLVESGPTLPEREARVREVQADLEAQGKRVQIALPFNSVQTIHGQGTLGLDILRQLEPSAKKKMLLIPVGGGGLIAGVALACQGQAVVVGAEPKEANDAQVSLSTGVRAPLEQPGRTVCDAVSVQPVGEHGWQVLNSPAVAAVCSVEEADVASALRLILERTKQFVEPTGALALACALFSADFKEELAKHPEVEEIVVLLCGGNADIATVAEVCARSA